MRLVLNKLSCRRGDRLLVSDLSLVLNAGEGVLLQGPNGSGKTTLLKTIAGFLVPAAGRIALEEKGGEFYLSDLCHFLGHSNGLKASLTVDENAEFWMRYLGGDTPTKALELLGFQDKGHLPTSVLSAGQRRRLALVRLLVVPRPIWLLDEPNEALDSEGQKLLQYFISEHLNGGGIVIAASHASLGPALQRKLTLKIGLST